MQAPDSNFHSCLKEPEENLGRKCILLRQALFECKRGQARSAASEPIFGLLISLLVKYAIPVSRKYSLRRRIRQPRHGDAKVTSGNIYKS